MSGIQNMVVAGPLGTINVHDASLHLIINCRETYLPMTRTSSYLRRPCRLRRECMQSCQLGRQRDRIAAPHPPANVTFRNMRHGLHYLRGRPGEGRQTRTQ